jgi:D-glycero-D-manno-heptose 1,7-bisphosphate phosphatase
MTVEDLTRVHEYMRFLLGESGAAPDAVYFCPHEKHTGCGCRKPDPGMLLAAMRDLDVDPHVSFMVGDSPSDIQAGAQAGVRTVRISDAHDPDADFTFGSLDAFACALAREIRAGSEPFPRTKGR